MAGHPVWTLGMNTLKYNLPPGPNFLLLRIEDTNSLEVFNHSPDVERWRPCRQQVLHALLFQVHNVPPEIRGCLEEEVLPVGVEELKEDLVVVAARQH